MLGMSPLHAEREQASFPVRELTFLLYGGREKTERQEELRNIVESDPVFDNLDLPHLTRADRYRRAMQKQRRLVEVAEELKVGIHELRGHVHDDLGTDLQNLMFVPNLRATFNEEQQKHWLPRALAWEVIGCYAQTELGHGSNVRALETTATYDPETDEIELHSPTTTSTKWWPGALGRTANHAIAYARLIVNGYDLGIHNFIVPIRDLETHQPLSGITVGDIGPKIGYNNQDNGFLRFEHVRIPRTYMAMKHATLHPGGAYESSKQRTQASYSSMTHVRSQIVMGSASTLSSACTIAVRYSAVRHQGFSSHDDGSETCILDYTMQQQRLLPLLATSYAFHFTGKAMHGLTKSGDATAIHLASSGLKALCTRITSDGIETCRRACGGHGYLVASGLPNLFGTYVQNCTVEGENYMIAQQTAKGLLKMTAEQYHVKHDATVAEPVISMQHVSMEGSTASVDYLQDVIGAAALHCAVATKDDFLVSELHSEAYKQRAAWLLLNLHDKLHDSELNGANAVDAWDFHCPDAIRLSEAHCFCVLQSNFSKGIEEVGILHPDLAPILQNCYNLFSLWWMQEHLGDFLEGGYLDSAQAGMLREAMRDQLAIVRKDAVPLCDAWNHSDHALQSVLGRYDGQVYEALFASAQPAVNPMNYAVIDPAFEESLKPMRRSRL